MSHRFDDLTKALANTRSRRGVLKLMGAGTLGSLFSGIFAGGVSANSRLSATLCSLTCVRAGPTFYRACVSECASCVSSGGSPGVGVLNDSPFFLCCPEGTYFNRVHSTCEPRFQSCLGFCNDAPGVDASNYRDCFRTCRGCQSQGLQAGWNAINATTMFYCCPPDSFFDETAQACVSIYT